MRSFAIGCLGIALALLFAGPTRAQTATEALRLTQRAPATGARMMGLGGAGTAGLQDYAAFVYNPAALGYFNHSEVSGAFRALSAQDDGSYRVPGAGVSSLDDDVRDYGIGNLAYIYKAPTSKGSFVLGAALNQTNTYEQVLAFEGANSGSSISQAFLPYASEYEIDENGSPSFFADLPLIAYNAGAIEYAPIDNDPSAYPFIEAVLPSASVQQQGDVTQSGQMRELNVGGAVEASRNVMIGVSANVSFGSYAFDRIYNEIDANNETTLNDYSVLVDGNTYYRGFSELEYRMGYESDLTGVNVRGGLSGEVLSGLRAGVTLESPTFYSVQEDYHRGMTTYFDDGNSLEYGGQTGDAGTGEFEYKIRTPWRLSGGLAYTVGAATLSGDVEFVDWSQMELNTDTDPQYFNAENKNIEDNFQAVTNLRTGLEYRFSKLSLRGGFAYYPYPVDTGGQAVDAERIFYSAGLGYSLSKRMNLDLAWMQEQFDDQYTPYNRVEHPPVVDEDVTRNRFTVGVRYAF